MSKTPLQLLTCLLLCTSRLAAQQSSFSQWSHGPSPDPGFFPIAVWLQDPSRAAQYKSAGFNLYLALWNGPTEKQLADLKAVGMPVICDQNKVGLAHLGDPTIVGWMQPDEPDNAQEIRDRATGKRSFGPPVRPQKIVDDYLKMKAADPTRPIYLGLGQGVGNDEWNGRGSAGKPEDYPIYVQGGDIISYDIYPIASLPKAHPEDYLWWISKGIDRIHAWTGGKKLQWNVVECTHIGNAGRQATPQQVRSEVWMSIINGSSGIVYFVHQFQPKFNEHALLDDPPMLAAVAKLNHEIQDLAPVLNSPSVDLVKVTSAEKAPVDAMVKRYHDSIYVFAVAMRNQSAKGSFSVVGLKNRATIEVIGENRRLIAHESTFADDFSPYEMHQYKIDSTSVSPRGTGF